MLPEFQIIFVFFSYFFMFLLKKACSDSKKIPKLIYILSKEPSWNNVDTQAEKCLKIAMRHMSFQFSCSLLEIYQEDRGRANVFFLFSFFFFSKKKEFAKKTLSLWISGDSLIAPYPLGVKKSLHVLCK